MKHSNNRRSYVVMRYLRIVLRRVARKIWRFMKADGVVTAALLCVMTLCLGLSVSVDAIDIPGLPLIKTQSDDEVENKIPLEPYAMGPVDVRLAALPAAPEYWGSTHESAPLMTTARPEATTTVLTTSTATSTTSTEETQVTTIETETVTIPTDEPIARDEVQDTEPVFESEEKAVFDYVSENDIIMLAKTVAQEGGDCSYVQQACVVWTVLNRVDSPSWPNSISENLTMAGQFAYYSNKAYRDDHYQVAYDQVYNWLNGGDRYLSGEYQYFYGDGYRNHFYGTGTGEYVPD